MACTREQLLDLARVFGLKGFSRLAKPGLVLMLLEKVAPGSLLDHLRPIESRLNSAEVFPGAPAAPSLKPKKRKRLAVIAIWATIVGFGISVIALAVSLIINSCSTKQIKDVQDKLVRFDPLTRDKVLQERESLLEEKEKKIKELEKAVVESCASTPQERQEAQSELAKGNMGKVQELFKKSIARKCGFLAEDYYNLGIAYFFDKSPDYRAALDAFLEADRLIPGKAEYLNMIGRAYQELGEYARAKDYFDRALAIDEQVYGHEHPAVARDLNNLGGAYFKLGDKKRARDYFERAHAIFKKFFGDQHPSTQTVKENLDDCR